MVTQRGWRLALFAAVLLVGRVAAQTAPSQAPPPARAPDLRMLSLQSLKAGRNIRVTGRDIGTVTGSFSMVRDGSLWLAPVPNGRNVPVAGIDSVWVSHGHAGTGALVGGLLGIPLGAAAISGKSCPFLDQTCLTEGYVKFTGVWLGSMLLGAIIGDLTKSWDRRYP